MAVTRIKLNVDTKAFTHKPKGGEAGGVSNRTRCAAGQVEIAPAELQHIVCTGRTFTPALLKGAKSSDWISQQILCIDVDNEEFLKGEDGRLLIDENGKNICRQVADPTSPKQARQILADYGINPLLLYYSFSSTDSWQRFRVVILLQDVLTDVEKAKDYTLRLVGIIPHADPAIATPERLIYGGRSDCIIYSSEDATAAAVLDQLPVFKQEKPQTVPAAAATGSAVKPLSEVYGMKKDSTGAPSLADVNQRVRDAIRSFDMAAFIESTTDARPVKVGGTLYYAPCPVCGRTSNHLQIRGSTWQCYDTNNTTGHKGGDIISWLEAVYNYSPAEAMAQFEYTIMGFSREERKAAFRAEKEAEEDSAVLGWNDTISYDGYPQKHFTREELKAGLEKLHSHAHRDAEDAAEDSTDVDPQQEELTEEEKAAQLEEQRQNYVNQHSAASHLQEFINGVAASADTPAIPTGFAKLDAILDGGLYEGLYTVGAVSSVGKTTFLLQIADQIAMQGTDVLYFSLEMARTELMAKSISRHTLQEAIAAGIPAKYAKSNRGITAGARYKLYNKQELQLIQTAEQKYSEYADHIFIAEGVGDMSVNRVRECVQKHIQFTGRKPVVIVDYLQILAPVDVRATDKQNTDKSVLELKRISRDYKIPVIAISSLNRDSYKEGSSNKGVVSMADLKESGAIEYGSDLLIGLQHTAAGTSGYSFKTEDSKDPKEIDAVIIKNRNGKKGVSVSFKYYPVFNCYKEV